MTDNGTDGLDGLPTVNVEELLDEGIVEANRQFFHVLGQALAVEGGHLVVIDNRDDPEGVIYQGVDLTDKAERVAREWRARSIVRRERFGWVVQPVEATR